MPLFVDCGAMIGQNFWIICALMQKAHSGMKVGDLPKRTKIASSPVGTAHRSQLSPVSFRRPNLIRGTVKL
jgi:hypothetical protein